MIENLLNCTVITKHKTPESVFMKLQHDEKLNLLNNNQLNCFALDISNNKFSYVELFDLLKENLGSYVLSRKEYSENPERAISKAIDKMRKITSDKDLGAGGELGEMLLYVFLEHYLKAPKILSKVELKTTPNQYVFNSDGVHFYQFEQDNCKYYQLVIGESKLKGNLKNAVDEAFTSIVSSKLGQQNDIDLVNSQILKETFSLESASKLKELIIPNATEDDKNNVFKSKAFGIFIGSNFKVDQNLPFKEQKDKMKLDLTKQTKHLARYINDNIKTHNLSGYSFYIYYLPFNDAMKDRKEIIKQLMTKNSYEEI